MSIEESTCVCVDENERIQTFAYEVNQNNLDLNRLKTFVIQLFLCQVYTTDDYNSETTGRYPPGKSIYGNDSTYYVADGQSGASWLPPPAPPMPPASTYLASEHGTFTDPNGVCLPSMASFRSQGTPYTTNGNESTVQTGETLGKALQSV